TTLFLI
ncbi:unnamed protein product, partial [Rotaria magnacalcarata]